MEPTAAAVAPAARAPPPAPPKPGRLTSLDIFRGATIALMILANCHGADGKANNLGPLQHGGWHQMTLTDWIFPFFIFIMGVAMPFSFSRRLAEPNGKLRLHLQLVRRCLLLFLLGWLIHLSPQFAWKELRILGVPPRLGLCYLFAGLIALHFGRRMRLALIPLLLLGYWALMVYVPFPGKTDDPWARGGRNAPENLTQYIDQKVLGVHLESPYDMESKGILSTVPAITNALVGFLCGVWLRSSRSPLELSNGLFVGGTLFVVAGLIWHDLGVPFNQGLWTPSFAALTCGLAMLALAACYWRIDISGRSLFNSFFLVFGANSLFAFMGHQVLRKYLDIPKVFELAGQAVPFRTFVYSKYLAPWAGPLGGSLLYALVNVAFWWTLCWILWRRRIFIKV